MAAEISRLLDVIDVGDLAVRTANQFLPGIIDGTKKMQPEISDEALRVVTDAVLTEFKKGFASAGTLRAAFVALYAKHFTREDISVLTAFYQTETGKKTLRLVPIMLQEGDQVGRDWVIKNAPAISQAVQTRIKEAGFPPLPK